MNRQLYIDSSAYVLGAICFETEHDIPTGKVFRVSGSKYQETAKSIVEIIEANEYTSIVLFGGETEKLEAFLRDAGLEEEVEIQIKRENGE